VFSKPAALAAATAVALAACAGPALKPAVAPAGPHRDALLILPGFGYGRHDAAGFASIERDASAAGIDVYVAKYLTRTGLDTSRESLESFIRAERLDRYERLHVFAFIAGAWTINPAIVRDAAPNLASIVYDRSPYQERAPRIAVEDLPLLAWLRYGSTIFDVARTAYPPVAAPALRIALLVETKPTTFIRHHAREAAAGGPFDAACGAFRQRYDDCAYLPLSHDQMYSRFADVWPDVKAFIRVGRFTDGAIRTAPSASALSLAPAQK
jgi:hypothetical protein